MRPWMTALAAGLLFGAGLVVSGMIDTANVVGFLDVTRAWNPRLLAVMAGAVGVHAGLLRLLRRRGAGRSPGAGPIGGTVAGGRRALRGRGVDGALVLGSAIFGVGWGLSGFCPGPAVVALGLGAGRVWAFVAAVVAGTLLADRWLARRFDRPSVTRAAAVGAAASVPAGSSPDVDVDTGCG